MAKKAQAPTEEDLVVMKIAKTPILRTDWLSSGSTLLNLAVSGNPNFAFTKGRYFWVCGDSSAGKTVLTLTSLAEAANDPNWDLYDLIFDNVEDGALMNIEKFYGKKLADRLISPRQKNGLPVYSSTIEDFYFGLSDRLDEVEAKRKRPFIYLLDSMDALSSDYERKKFQEKKVEHDGGAKAKGDYGDGKAKINSKTLRDVVTRLRDLQCTLIILSQTRDNIDASMFEPDSITAGGRALKFYASVQLWLSIGAKLKKEVNSIERQIGVISRVAVKKNRVTGKEWTVEIPLYHSFGIDDVGSCVDYLLKEKHWGVEKSKIFAKDFEFEGNRERLIKHIESNGLEFDLRTLVGDVWQAVEESCKVNRKSRFQ